MKNEYTEIKKYTQEELDDKASDAFIKGIDREQRKIMSIINYILSKNITDDQDTWEETIDYEKLYKDLEEFRSYLNRKINNK